MRSAGWHFPVELLLSAVSPSVALPINPNFSRIFFAGFIGLFVSMAAIFFAAHLASAIVLHPVSAISVAFILRMISIMPSYGSVFSVQCSQ